MNIFTIIYNILSFSLSLSFSLVRYPSVPLSATHEELVRQLCVQLLMGSDDPRQLAKVSQPHEPPGHQRRLTTLRGTACSTCSLAISLASLSFSPVTFDINPPPLRSFSLPRPPLSLATAHSSDSLPYPYLSPLMRSHQAIITAESHFSLGNRLCQKKKNLSQLINILFVTLTRSG